MLPLLQQVNFFWHSSLLVLIAHYHVLYALSCLYPTGNHLIPNPTLLLTLLFLAFFRLLTGLIESTYAFGLLQTDIPPEIGFVLLLLSPLALLISPRWVSGRAARSLALSARLLVLLGWGLLPWLDTREKLLAGGIGAGLFWLFLPAFLRAAPGLATPFHMGGALALAGLASIFLHALNAGLPPDGAQARLVYGLLAGLGMVLLSGRPALAAEPALSAPPRRPRVPVARAARPPRALPGQGAV